MSEGATQVEIPDVPLDARCLACAYSLRGLTGRRCPECGRPFDPTDPTTMACAAGRSRRWEQLLRELGRLRTFGLPPWFHTPEGKLFCCSVLAAAMLWRVPDSSGLGPFGIARVLLYWYGTFLMPCTLVLGVAYAVTMQAARRVPIRREVWVLWLVLPLITVVRSTWLDHCPHGRYVGVGPWAVVTEGTGCDNWRLMTPLVPSFTAIPPDTHGGRAMGRL